MLELLAISMLKSRVTWEQYLEHTFRDNEWEAKCAGAQNISYSSSHKLLQLNLVHRIYYTPERLHRMNSAISETCPRCKTDRSNLMHMFWSCKKWTHYSDSILDVLKKVTRVEIPHSPRLALLGDVTALTVGRRIYIHFIKLAFIAGNKCIVIMWKSELPPPVSLWLKEVASYMASDKNYVQSQKETSSFFRQYHKMCRCLLGNLFHWCSNRRRSRPFCIVIIGALTPWFYWAWLKFQVLFYLFRFYIL